eukprot:m.35448 g.35448  ORF g.35448 m.35448 type:complete len:180 (+) comp9891_c0_seq2:107-646(+)
MNVEECIQVVLQVQQDRLAQYKQLAEHFEQYLTAVQSQGVDLAFPAYRKHVSECTTRFQALSQRVLDVKAMLKAKDGALDAEGEESGAHADVIALMEDLQQQEKAKLQLIVKQQLDRVRVLQEEQQASKITELEHDEAAVGEAHPTTLHQEQEQDTSRRLATLTTRIVDIMQDLRLELG